jgi:capsular exopolysaccharide synthesis family protein
VRSLLGLGRADRDADQATSRSESFRVLRTNLEVALADFERPTVLVTSSNPNEGKTATCGQLAQALALGGRRVVVVDLDLRHPDVHNWLGGDNIRGVSDVLLERCSVREALQFLHFRDDGGRDGKGLYLLSAGTTVPNPTELLGSARTARLLDVLSRQADVVLLDTPPVLPVADTLVIGRMVSGAVVVVEARSTPVDAVQAACAALIRNQTRLLGLVVNKMLASDARPASGYGYGYGYGSEEPVPGGEPPSNGSTPPA